MNTLARILMLLLLCFNLGASLFEDCFAEVDFHHSNSTETQSYAPMSVSEADEKSGHDEDSNLCHHGICHFGHCSHLQLSRSSISLQLSSLDHPLILPRYAFGLSFEYQAYRLRPPSFV